MLRVLATSNFRLPLRATRLCNEIIEWRSSGRRARYSHVYNLVNYMLTILANCAAEVDIQKLSWR
jgi:hypothetical protein